MKTKFNKKHFITFLAIIIDILVIAAWVLYFKPSDDKTIVLVFIIPFVFLVNLVIGCIVYFIKKYYTPFFLINAFISSIMIFLFFTWYIKIDNIKNYESWEFLINNTNYEISFYIPTEDNSYSLVILCNGWSRAYDRGIYHVKNDTVFFLSTDSCKYYIYGDTLYDFENIKKITVKKKY
jgi:hypothetical protein